MRHGLCAAVLCALAAPAPAEAPLPKAATGVPKVALAPLLTPTKDTGGVTAPLPRGNPGDPSARESREVRESDANVAAEAAARDSDTERKGGAAGASGAGRRDTEDK